MITGYTILLLCLILFAKSVLLDWLRSRRLYCVPIPRPFRNRTSQRDVWLFGMEEEADALLLLLCESFGFNPDDRYQFAPNDRIIDIYRACYPPWRFWRFADSMEMESLMIDLSEQFGLEEEDLPVVPLREIVERIGNKRIVKTNGIEP